MATIQTLKERISSYEDIYDYKILPKLPLIIVVNGRKFSNLTQDISKPTNFEFTQIMCSTAFRTIQEIEGCVFGYIFNDEMVFILKNDLSNHTQPWYDNKIQKLVSSVSSISTIEFVKACVNFPLKLKGSPVFISNIFAVPNNVELINALICKQQECFQTAVHQACYYELIKKYDDQSIKDILLHRTAEEKIEILSEECGINFYNYPQTFYRGIACYRNKKENNIPKDKWFIDTELPSFAKDNSLLSSILR